MLGKDVSLRCEGEWIGETYLGFRGWEVGRGGGGGRKRQNSSYDVTHCTSPDAAHQPALLQKHKCSDHRHVHQSAAISGRACKHACEDVYSEGWGSRGRAQEQGRGAGSWTSFT